MKCTSSLTSVTGLGEVFRERVVVDKVFVHVHARGRVVCLDVVEIPPRDQLRTTGAADRCVDEKVCGGCAHVGHLCLRLRHWSGATGGGRRKGGTQHLILVIGQKPAAPQKRERSPR